MSTSYGIPRMVVVVVIQWILAWSWLDAIELRIKNNPQLDAALWDAVGNGRANEIQQLINKGANPNACNDKKNTVLIWGAGQSKKPAKAVEALLKKKADVNAQNDEGTTALMAGAFGGNLDVVKVLLQYGAEPNIQQKTGSTALMAASDKGHLEIVKLLVEKGADIHLMNNDRWNAVKFASRGSFSEVVQFLVSKGASEADAASARKAPPLTVAVLKGNLESVKSLLAKGEKPDVVGWTDEVGNARTPLIDAGIKGRIDIMQALLDAHASLEFSGENGSTALMEISKTPNLASVKFLIEKGANLNAHGKMGHSAVLYAAYNGQLEIVKFLVEHGADPKLAAYDDAEKQHPYDAIRLARQQGHPEVAEYLKQHEETKPLAAPGQ